ncbi:MAG TPA: hypothetical protein VG225_03680 [Terracidiphilus sp.]|nr:hypothetical protein [Terracidiphilus sp.]
MKKITLAISLLFGFGTTVYSQEQAPQLLLHAAQCLGAKQFLPSSKATKLTLGYFLDEKSYPGTKEMYVVIYAAPAKSNGLVFALVLTQPDDHEVFDIQNNASFVLSKDEPIGVSFVTPPLGGTWTQEHLASAITRIEEQPRFMVSVENLLVVDSSATCESYTDPQPKPGKK